MTLCGRSEQAGELPEGGGGHQDLLALGQHRGAREVTHGEAVGVGGHQAQAVALGGHQHAGEDRSGLVVARGGHDLAQGVGEGHGVEAHRRLGRLGAAAGTRGPGWCAPRTASDPNRCGPRRRRSRRSPRRAGGPGRCRRAAWPAPRPRRRRRRDTAARTEIVRSRSLPVTWSWSPCRLEAEPAQDGQGAAPGGDGTGGGVQRLDQRITLATELHAVSLSVSWEFIEEKAVVVIGAVDCGRRSIVPA